MITFSIIQKSQLEGAQRIDAEYYQPEYLEIISQLSKEMFNSKPLRELVLRPVVTGSTPKIRDCKGDGTDIKFIKTDTLRVGEIVFESADCLPLNQNTKNSELKSGDILVTIIGATYEIVGRTALFFEDDPKSNINQNVALIRVKNEIIPGYLEAFLLSKFGRYQLWQQSRQTEQVNLNCREIENILIPSLSNSFQEKINGLIVNSRHSKFDSIVLYKQAEKLLLQELGLKDFLIKNDLSYVVNFSDVKNADRVDAEYFQPKYEKLELRIKDYHSKTLGELVAMKKGIEPGSEAYQEEGKLFIRVSSLSKFGIESIDQKYLREDLYQKLTKEFQPQIGEILLTKDATPGIAYVVKEPIEGIISGGIMRLKIKENLIDPEYLALCVNSLIGQMQSERDAGGSIIVHWKSDQIKNIVIPILPQEKQLEIADLIKKSHEARKKSKQLLDQAKKEVEEMIEKGGKN